MRWLGLVVAFWVAGCASREAPAVVSADQLRPPAPASLGALKEHELLSLRLEGETLTVTGRRRVEGPLPVDRDPASEPWRLRVEDSQGLPLFVAALPRAGIRAEVADEGGKLRRVPVEGAANFVARVPVLEDAAVVRLFGRAETGGGEFLELGRAPLGPAR